MVVLLVILAILALGVLLTAYICFRMAFYADRRPVEEEYPIPEGEIYEPYREQMVAWMKETRATPHEDMEIQSFDGLTLRGKYYECVPGGPIELMFHGYRGNANRDLCGGMQRCFELKRNTLIVDQRSCGSSEGNIITFGIHESDDCHRWIAHLIQRFGPEVKILITGISMGASTVMLAAGRELPEQVVGVLADCGYTSAEDIIKVVIRYKRLPPKLAYPFVKLGAKLFGHFDPDSDSPIEAMRRCKVPVMFIHGEADDFVPCDMSRRNFGACAAEKKLWTVPGAGHGLSFLVDKPGYMQALHGFFDPILEEKNILSGQEQ